MKKSLSTFDRLMKDPKKKADFDKGYEKFLASEFKLEEAMEKKNLSVKKCIEIKENNK